MRLGDVDLESDADDSTVVELQVVKISRHPGYRRPNAYFDVAVAHLQKAVIFTGQHPPSTSTRTYRAMHARARSILFCARARLHPAHLPSCQAHLVARREHGRDRQRDRLGTEEKERPEERPRPHHGVRWDLRAAATPFT